MVNYECIICKYITNNKKDYGKHIKTKKHIKKETCQIQTNPMPPQTTSEHPRPPQNTPEQISKKIVSFKNNKIMCKLCAMEFSRQSSLTRHNMICPNNTSELSMLKLKVKQLEKESKYFQAENNYHKQMLNEAGGLVKKSVSALTYVAHNYSSAPTIEKLDIEDMEDLEENNKKLVEDVISAHRHKTLDRYLGDSIIKLYKKEKTRRSINLVNRY